MAALFPRWFDSLARAVLVAALVSAVSAIALPMIWVRTPFVTGQYDPVEQPVQFDHRHHVADDGIDCRYCHDLAERSPVAGVPPTERCLNCHSQIWNDSPLLEPVWLSFTSGLPIPWVRVHRLPDFVYFDHSIHVNNGVACETCHGRIDRMARVYQVAPLTMGWCLECHRNPEPHLRPRDAVTVMGWEPDRDGDATGPGVVRTPDVRRLTHCSACHR
ncbi:MAG TPA: cytochrome c3 family protein [Longimicrobiales bacterium]|nr:cytochrome c3 family protein [Longimicrobiales bacterium]